MSDLKNDLQQLFDKLKGLETRARGLKNQNLADIAASAHGRIHQLVNHPDLELVDEKKDPAPEGEAAAGGHHGELGDPNVKHAAPGCFGRGPHLS